MHAYYLDIKHSTRVPNIWEWLSLGELSQASDRARVEFFAFMENLNYTDCSAVMSVVGSGGFLQMFDWVTNPRLRSTFCCHMFRPTVAKTTMMHRYYGA